MRGAFIPLSATFHPLGQSRKIDFAASAGRTGDDVRTDLPDIERPEYPVRHADLLDGRTGDGDPDRVADAVIQERPDADGGFDGRLDERSRLGHAEMQGIIGLLGDEPVGLDRGRHIGGFQGELDGIESPSLPEDGWS